MRVDVKKLIIQIEAEKDCAYDNAYHRKLHGRILNAIPDEFVDIEQKELLGISFTGILPWGDVKAGDTRRVVVSSIDREIIAHLIQSLRENPEFNIGEMEFTVTGLSEAESDVGQPGSYGSIESDTGILISFQRDNLSEYGITAPGDSKHNWGQDDPQEAFFARLRENIKTKWNKMTDSNSGGPHELNGPLFDRQTLNKTFSIPLRVAEDHTQKIVLSKWSFEYEIRSEAHRNTLNLALGAGLGERNNFGLGTVSLTSKQEPVLTGM